MDPAPIPPQSSDEHATIITLVEASGECYCALTSIHRDDNQPQCVISRRIGSRQPSFVRAMQYTATNFYTKRRPDSINWTDHEFELLANGEVLHRFAIVRVTAGGDFKRENVDLASHEARTADVQAAIRLLRKIGA